MGQVNNQSSSRVYFSALLPWFDPSAVLWSSVIHRKQCHPWLLRCNVGEWLRGYRPTVVQSATCTLQCVACSSLNLCAASWLWAMGPCMLGIAVILMGLPLDWAGPWPFFFASLLPREQYTECMTWIFLYAGSGKVTQQQERLAIFIGRKSQLPNGQTRTFLT